MKNGMNQVLHRWMVIFCLGFYGIGQATRPDQKKLPNINIGAQVDFQEAIKASNIAEAERLITAFSTINVTEGLRYATTPEAIRFLASKKADLNKVFQFFETPLVYALTPQCQPNNFSEEERCALVKTLLECGADPRATVGAHHESSPIDLAAINGYSTIIAELLRNGVPVDSTAFRGARTPLHLACYNAHLEAVKTLVAAGANCWCKDSYGITPFGSVNHFFEDRSLERESMVTYMLNLLGEEVFTKRMYDSGPTIFEQACSVKSYCLPLYLERAPKEFLCNFKDFFNQGTVLHVIVAMNREKYPEEVKKSLAIALAKGVDCNAKDTEGNTPLHCAAAAENLLFVQKLLLPKQSQK